MCELCGESADELVFSQSKLAGPLVKCRHCGLYRVIPETRVSGLHDFEAELLRKEKYEGYTQQAETFGLVDQTTDEQEEPYKTIFFRQRLQFIQKYKTKGKLLDIGCEKGIFLNEARQAGFDVMGVEPFAETAKTAVAKYNLKVFNGTLKEAAIPAASFDIITLFHVLEHFGSPVKEMEEIGRILKPGGYLIIETPNIRTVWFRLLGKRWREFIPDHFYFFSAGTLKLLMRKNGLRVKMIKKVGKTMSIRFFVNRLSRHSHFLAGVLDIIIRIFKLQDKTISVNLGDIIFMIAQKEVSNKNKAAEIQN